MTQVEAPKIELTLEQKIAHYSDKYGVSRRVLQSVINCETGGDYRANLQSKIIESSGHREESYGIAQIHLPDHREISYREATNIDFSLNYLAREISKGRGSQWTCWQLLGYN